jgi:hypothetical protein
MKRRASYECNSDATVGSKAGAQDPPSTPVTTLPKHLELFAQAIADGCNVREAAKRSGRKEGSGGYLNSRADVTQRVDELKKIKAQTANEHVAKKTAAELEAVDLDGGEIINGLASIARSDAPPGARVAAWRELAEIFHLKTKSPQEIRDFTGWTFEEKERYARYDEIPERFRAIVGESLSSPLPLRGEKG